MRTRLLGALVFLICHMLGHAEDLNSLSRAACLAKSLKTSRILSTNIVGVLDKSGIYRGSVTITNAGPIKLATNSITILVAYSTIVTNQLSEVALQKIEPLTANVGSNKIGDAVWVQMPATATQYLAVVSGSWPKSRGEPSSSAIEFVVLQGEDTNTFETISQRLTLWDEFWWLNAEKQALADYDPKKVTRAYEKLKETNQRNLTAADIPDLEKNLDVVSSELQLKIFRRKFEAWRQRYQTLYGQQ